jgi:BirA family biotin operon repressor/biotin-[acetyl-CoA-carboxylase] ligase
MKDVKQNTLKEEKIFKFLKKNCDFEWHLSLYEELESTNDYLIEFANLNEYCLCVAESQTKGRGRNLKRWQSPKYENIYMSLSFSTNQELKNFSSFSLVSALAVHNVLMRQNIFTEIKWPNDIFLNEKKIGGILIETLPRGEENLIVVGIGLNVFMENNSEIERDWTSLKLEFENIEIDDFVKDFNKLNFLRDKKVFLSNLINKEGTALDINSDGSLNVRIGNQIKKISSGEVSININ